MLLSIMKLWLKYAFGIAMGAILYIALPPSMVHGTAAIAFISEISLKIGGYALVFTLASGIPVSVFRLSEAHRFWKIFGQSFFLLVGSLIVAAGLGIAVALIFKSAPLPLITDSGLTQTLDPAEMIRSTFPSSIFSAFAGSDTWLLPLLLFGFAFGLAVAHDPVMARPLIPVLDVISRTAYLINTFISEILGILLIAVSLNLFLVLRNAGWPAEYRGILFSIGVAAVVVLFGLFPLAYRVLGGKANPYVLMYGMLGPLLAAAGSGSIFFSSGSAIRHLSESLGVKRDTNATIFPLALMAGRAGSALVVASAFIAMFLSYSRNGPGFVQLLLLLVLVPFSVFVASAGIRSDISVMLSLVCMLFGQGFQNGASLLVPVAFPLSILAVILDSAWMMFAVALIGDRQGERSAKRARNFI